MAPPNESDRSTPSSRGLFEQNEVEPTTPAAEPTGRSRAWWKVSVVLLLLLVVGVAIGLKVLRQRGPSGTTGAGAGRTGRDGPSPRSTNFLPEAVLATVGQDEITLRDLEEALGRLRPEVRLQLERQKHELLDELVTRRLLAQEARRLRMKETEAYRAALERAGAGADADAEEKALIDALFRTQVVGEISITEADRRGFYERRREELPQPATFEEWRSRLEPYVRQEKEGEAVEAYVARLRSGAAITRNEAWVEAQRQTAAQNPLDEALASGKPVLADFGRDTCIPCKMMKPILDELESELKDRVHVLVLDTSEYGGLARRHGVRIIPTQIFFDASGRELYRHQGFMGKDDIHRKLDELGML